MKKIMPLKNILKTGVILFLISLLIFQPPTEKAVALDETPDDVVTYLAKERNISIEEAEIRIGWQEKAGALDEKLKKIIPETDYGGTWINKTNDRVTIGFIPGSNTADSSKQIAIDELKAAGISDGADMVHVKHSLSSLERIADSIHRLHIENVRHDDWPIQVGTKTDLNKVQVDIPADNEHLTEGHRFVISEVEKNYKDQVFFETYSELPEDQAECNWWFCNSPLRGGVGIKGNYQDFSRINCTAGFIVKGNATGNFYILTAGHCEGAGYGWGTETYNYSTKLIGSVAMSLYDDVMPIDALIIKVKQDVYDWDVMGKILKRSGDSNMGLNGYSPPAYSEEYDMQDYSSSVVNERICVSGAITGGYPSEPNGGSCGAVHQTNVYVTSGGKTTRAHRAGYCSRGGDSGAPVFASQNDAKGIHKAAGDPAVVCSDYKYYTPMRTILDGFSSVGSSISVY
jgi:hypothetical protein